MCFSDTPGNSNNIDQHAINNNSKGIFINIIRKILKQIMAKKMRIDRCEFVENSPREHAMSLCATMTANTYSFASIKFI